MKYFAMFACSTMIAITTTFFACTSKHRVSTSSRPPADIRLYVFECGETLIKDLSLFATEAEKNVEKRFSVSCYIIKHPAGNLLWDAGLPDALAKEPKGMNVRNAAINLQVKRPFVDQLADIGLSPRDLHYVAFSHFHTDHVGNANAFPDATLLIQREEYDAAFGPQAETYGFDPSIYGGLKNNPAIILQGDLDVFGDQKVIIKAAKGHTPGHQMLFVRLANTGPIVLSGDLYHFAENREKQRVPKINFDKEKTLASMASMEDFIKKTGATLWIQHDYQQSKTLKHAPAYYD